MLISSVEIPATPQTVFAAMEDPVRLARWWGPNGFTSTFHTFEFQNGGCWLFTMHGPDGKDYPNEVQFLEIVPGATFKIRHVNLPHYDLTISLESTANGTLVTWHSVFENGPFVEHARQFLENANKQNLERLALQVGTVL